MAKRPYIQLKIGGDLHNSRVIIDGEEVAATDFQINGNAGERTKITLSFLQPDRKADDPITTVSGYIVPENTHGKKEEDGG